MVSKKVKIGALVVLALVVIGGIALFSGGGDDKNVARYNYDITLSEDTIGSGFLSTSPESGFQFAIVKYTMVNESFENGVSTNPFTMTWTVTANGVSYNHKSAVMYHPDYKETVTIEVGGTHSSVVLFEVPLDVEVDDITVNIKYSSSRLNLKLDSDIEVV